MNKYELIHGIEVYNKDAGDYIKSKDLVIDYKGQKGSTFKRSLQDKIFSYIMGLSNNRTSTGSDEDADAGAMTADTIIGIVSFTGNSSELYELIINSLKTFGTIGGTKCTTAMLDTLSEEDNDLIYEAVIRDFLSGRVIQQMKSMSK